MRQGSGYDIKKFCDKTISHFWNENFGHIYPVLKQLQQEGLIIQSDGEKQDRRKVYTITEKGKQAFYDWMIQPLEFQPIRSELLLKLSFGDKIPKESIIGMLEEVKARNIMKIEKYKEMEQMYLNNEKAKKDSQYIYLLSSLRFGITSAEATIKWCKETISLINNCEV